jgi:hypothetical protein
MSETIFRYKLSGELISKMKYFSEVHKYDSKEDFKEAWINWKNENRNDINEEMIRLTRLGYEGNVETKIYKSIRYYYCKKSNEKKEPKERREYVNIDDKFIKHIDFHIKENSDLKPSEMYQKYILTNSYKNLKENLREKLKNSEEIELKIKKTYKNRYFIYKKR